MLFKPNLEAILEEALKTVVSIAAQSAERSVTLHLQSQLVVLNGWWNWEMQTDSVYCSDVMFFPEDFNGTKGIVHPDDLGGLTKTLASLGSTDTTDLSFRIITTYGEVKTISGEQVSIGAENAGGLFTGKELWQEALLQITEKKENDFLQFRSILSEITEKLHSLGSYLFNKTTSQAWYSDNVFRIYKLAPQSLNAHAHTFSSFIHEDDRDVVLDAFEKTFRDELPLEIEYRVVLADKDIKFIQHITRWLCDSKGHLICCGIIRDVTNERRNVDELMKAQANTSLYQQLLKFSEQQFFTAYWHINLITRKVFYSDNYWRIFGVKPSGLFSLQSFLNFVHADDREAVKTLFDKMFTAYAMPDCEFRIIRPDGKTRFIRQCGRFLVDPNKEPVMIGVLRDITVERKFELRTAELNEALSLNKFITETTETVCNLCSIIWNQDGTMQFSDGLLRMTGIKPADTELLSTQFTRIIYPDDQQIWDQTQDALRQHLLPGNTVVRIISKTGIKSIKISFTQLSYEKEAIIGVLQDVTEQTSLQQKFAEDKLLSSLLLENVNDIIVFTNSDHTILSWNEKAQTKTGIRKEDALYQNLFDVLPSLNEESFISQLTSVLNGGEISSLQTDKGYFLGPHQYSLLPLKDDNNNVKGVLHLVHDISRQLQLQIQLHERLNFIERLVESSADRIVVLDGQMNYLYWNQKAEEYYGIEKEKVIGKNILEIFPGFRNDPGYHEFRKVLRGETVFLPAKHNEEDDDYAETYLTPIKDENGNVTAVLWIVHDLSSAFKLYRQKQIAEEQIREQAHFIERIAEMVPDVISVMELDSRRLSYFNKQMLAIDDASSEEMTGTIVDQSFTIAPQDQSVLDHYYKKFETASDSDVIEAEYRAKNQQDEWQWFHIRGKVFQRNGEGKATHVINVIENISQRKKMELRLDESRLKLESLLNNTSSSIMLLRPVRDEKNRIVDFQYLYTNEQTLRSVERESLEGKLFTQEFPLAADSELFHRYAKVVETGIAFQSQVNIEPYGVAVWVQVYAQKNGDDLLVTYFDITKIKKADQEVLRLKEEIAQQANNKYYSLFYSIGEGFSVLELLYDHQGKAADYRFVEVNPAFELQTGIKNVTGRNGKEVMGEATKQRWLEVYDKVLQTGEAAHFEDYHEATDRWYRIYASRIGNQSSHLLATVFDDITQGKRSEEKQQYLLKLSDALGSAANAEEIQEKAALLIGNQLKVARAFYFSVEAHEQQYIYTATQGYYRYRQMESLEYKYRPTVFASHVLEYLPSGKTLVIPDVKQIATITDEEATFYSSLQIGSFVVVPLIKSGKYVCGFAVEDAVARNWKPHEISLIEETAERTWSAVERARAEEALRASEENYRSLFNAIDEGFAMCEVIRDENENVIDYRFLDLNPAFEKHFGLKRSAVVGKRCNEVLPGDENALKMYADVVALNRQVRREFYSQSVERWYDISVYPRGLDRFAIVFDDITVRKDVEGRIRNSSVELEEQIEQRTQELQKQLTLLRYTEYLAQSGSWEYEIETKEFKWSDGMYKMFGLSPQKKVDPEIYLQHAIEEDRAIAKSIVNQLKISFNPFEEIIRIRRNGDVRTIKIKASVVADEKESAKKIIGVGIDITNIQRTEEKLKESRHWLDQTAKASPDSITVYDLEKMQPVYLNNCLGDWLGISSSKLVQMGMDARLKLIHPDDRSKLLQFNDAVISSKEGDMHTIEYRIKTAGGKTLWLRNRAKVFQRDHDGNATHILSILQDVTEEVYLRKELKRRTEYAESVIDASIDRIAVYDKQFKVIAWNKRAEQVTGRKKENVLGQKLFEVFPKVAQDEVLLKAHLDALQGSYVALPAKKGVYTNSYYERFYIPLKNNKGEVYAVVSVMHDVSELVNRNTELSELNKSLEQKNIQLAQKNEEITHFAFVASHDMREPLRKIHTFSDWLMLQEAGHFSPKGKDLVGKINASIKRMEWLIDDILVLTKIHSDTHKADAVDLNKVLHQVADDLTDKIRQTQTEITSDQLPVIRGNDNQLFYLFKNLIANAIKFQKPGNVPKIKITSEIVPGEEVKIGDAVEEYVKLSFIDNGFGFDMRYAKKIFQVFQRLHGRHEFEGTGIGLAICKKIMENHEGMITVEAEEGNGAVFICYFPLQ